MSYQHRGNAGTRTPAMGAGAEVGGADTLTPMNMSGAC